MKVTLSNLEKDREVEVLDVPFAPEVGSHKVWLTKILYIDASDFRREDSKDYFGLAPGKVCAPSCIHAFVCALRLCWLPFSHATAERTEFVDLVVGVYGLGPTGSSLSYQVASERVRLSPSHTGSCL